MAQPQINENKFQEWLLTHSDTLMFGATRIDPVRILYFDAFAHGWYAAFELTEELPNNHLSHH
jgi:hypothetical protein